MKLSNIPEARLELTNRVLSDFFTGNGLPVTQITGRRARELLKWFAHVNSLNNSSRAINNRSYYGNGAPEEQRITIAWNQYGYHGDSDTDSFRRFNTRSIIRELGKLKLPDDLAQDIKKMRRVSITLSHFWEYKSFLFRLEEV